MYLKSIVLKGFKSFPDRTRLEFGPGVSVIVGPNGSGKSNVTDAVLWALGEQSPLAVRGQSMQDVIFGGAPGRHAATSAEIELVLDDSEGELGLGVPEISIFRRLDRTGEGEYRIAGARCRLIDVAELLSDSGLGKEMHSVISQGKVESIVTSRPRERRLLIEEAAGLGKHRKRRRRAQLKLGHTQDNLDRALDVEREARSRLRPLKRQAEAAELHARVHRQLQQVRFELTREQLRSRLSELHDAQERAERSREERAALARDLDAIAGRRQEAEEALAGRSAQREELSRRRFAAESATERVAFRAQSIESNAREMSIRREHNGERLERLIEQEAASPVDPANETRIAALSAELEVLERDREAALERRLADLRQELAQATQLEGDRVQELAAAQLARASADRKVEEGRGALDGAERQAASTRREAAKVGAELAAVNQFLRGHSPPLGGARLLAEALTVAAGYEAAVAAALDGRLAAALAADRATAVTLLDRAGAEGGRVLVTDRVSRERASGESSAADGKSPAPGAEPLANHIREDDDAARVARSLLRDVWIVESLERLDPSFDGVAVTADGRVWSARANELRQAAAVGEERVLAERNRREDLLRHSERAASEERLTQIELERATAELAELERASQQALAQQRAAQRESDEAAEHRRRLELAIDRCRAAPDEEPGAARRAQLRAELLAAQTAHERAERERADRAAAIERCQAHLSRHERLAPAVAGIIDALAECSEAIGERRAQFEAALAADREAGEHAAAALRAFAAEEAGVQATLQGHNEALTGLEVALQRADDQVGDTRQALGSLADELGLEAEPAAEPLDPPARAALDLRLERLQRRREQIGPVNPLAQDEYAEAREHVEELERQRADLENAMRELQKLIRETDKQIHECFDRTFKAAAANFEELVPRLFPGGGGRLRLVTERDGPAAVLGGAPGGRSRDPYAGEKAPELESDGEETVAEEDELLGVEIEITPAGKSMKRLSLLSGGEKAMTALAFLFSVFLARPCPFYILDEVEAALDDLNIDRFLELLDAYSQRAQFIVVTHQKRTMEAADSLYGVSMGGDGISKVVSRRLPAKQAA
jgi:chromosome segregation protein